MVVFNFFYVSTLLIGFVLFVLDLFFGVYYSACPLFLVLVLLFLKLFFVFDFILCSCSVFFKLVLVFCFVVLFVELVCLCS